MISIRHDANLQTSFHAQTSRLNTMNDVLQHAGRAGDDVAFDFETLAVHAHRALDAAASYSSGRLPLFVNWKRSV